MQLIRPACSSELSSDTPENSHICGLCNTWIAFLDGLTCEKIPIDSVTANTAPKIWLSSCIHTHFNLQNITR